MKLHNLSSNAIHSPGEVQGPETETSALAALEVKSRVPKNGPAGRRLA